MGTSASGTAPERTASKQSMTVGYGTSVCSGSGPTRRNNASSAYVPGGPRKPTFMSASAGQGVMTVRGRRSPRPRRAPPRATTVARGPPRELLEVDPCVVTGVQRRDDRAGAVRVEDGHRPRLLAHRCPGRRRTGRCLGTAATPRRPALVCSIKRVDLGPQVVEPIAQPVARPRQRRLALDEPDTLTVRQQHPLLGPHPPQLDPQDDRDDERHDTGQRRRRQPSTARHLAAPVTPGHFRVNSTGYSPLLLLADLLSRHRSRRRW